MRAMRTLGSGLVVILVLAFGMLAFGPGAARAQDWAVHTLRNVTFAVPTDWQETLRQRDQEVDFQSPDGRFELWARWWFPDEPLLGFPDIVSHKALTLAGNEALFIYSGPEEDRMLYLAFLKKDAEGEQFLFQLIAHGVALKDHEQMFNALVAHLSIDGVPLLGKAPASVPGQQTAAEQAVPPPPPAAGGIGLPLPPGWTASPLDGTGVRRILAVAPGRDALVLAAVATGQGGQDARALVDAYLGLLHRDTIVVKEIRGETYPQIAGNAVHALDVEAKIFPVDGVALPYQRGRVGIYQGGDAARAFLVVTMRPADEDGALANALDTIARGLDLDAATRAAPAAPPVPVAQSPVDPETQGSLDSLSAAIPPTPHPSAPGDDAAGSEWLPELTRRFGDCRLVPLANWSDPVRPELEKAKVDLRFVALCQGGAYPVYGVHFPYDPRGPTEDYFHPLYAGVFVAGGNRACSFLEVEDRVLSSIGLKDATTLRLDLEDLPAAGAPGDGVAVAAPGTPAAPPLPTATAAAGPQVLFDGKGLGRLVPFGFAGGDFATQAQLTGKALRIEIPKDSGWARIGLATPDALIRMPDRGAARAVEIAATIDGGVSNGLSFALTPPDKAALDPDEGHDIALHLVRGDDGIARATMTRRDLRPDLQARFPWPGNETDLALVLRPDQVAELRRGDGTRLAWFDIGGDFAGRDWVLQTYLQVPGKHRAASLKLTGLAVGPVPEAALPDIDAPAEGPRSLVLFDGTAIVPVWAAIQPNDLALDRLGALDDGALRIAWPEIDRTSYLGLYTPEAALWLDDFRADARARIGVEFDGEATGDVEISFQQAYGLPNNLTGNGAYALGFRRQEDGTYTALSAVKAREKEGLRAEGLARVPDHVDLIVTPRGVAVEAEGLSLDPVPVPDLADGVGLRFWVVAQKPASGTPRLTLRRVEADYRPGPAAKPPEPAAGVAPLEETVIFDGSPGTGWTPVSAGDAVFEELAAQTADGLTLARREAPPNSNRIALASAAAVIDIDKRIETTPLEVRFQFDPAEPDIGTRVFFTTNPGAYADKAGFVVSLRRLPEGRNEGRVQVTLHAGHFSYGHWTRTLPAGWQETWDGRMTLVLGAGRVAVMLGDREVLAANTDRSGRFRSYHIAIVPGGLENRGSGRVTLRRIATAWRMPDGMTEMDRLRLVDADAFDAEAFADLLAAQLTD
ncbi:hypothetical protein [Rhodovulum euryhalinum]|nr:hypothetical protein [Rhodovulum euryhalinum]